RPGCQKACVLPENPASYRVVRTKSYLFNKALWSYDHPLATPHSQTLTFIPWFSWANRGEGEMRIWVREAE
ncbi:hypothetical protein, partial [Klebsiella quasipneumoniae]|uniref:hypothetical protein n=1 Tax=Klebsiella quasipneumoniae TaxID=1463165 RepID=UPI002ABCD827